MRDPCADVERLLWRFIDRELDDVTVEELRRHLRFCDDCGDRHEFEVRLRAIIRQKCAGRAPESLRRRVLELLREL